MGDPRKTRKKYDTPEHPWIAGRIEEEREVRKQFGTKNKKEIYKMDSALKRFKDQAKTLVSRTDNQAVVEREQMVNKMVSLGLVKTGATLDDILSLTVTDIMNRRLQTVLVKRLLARSPKQARQLIVHGHVIVGDKLITSPSYLVRVDEEARIGFRNSSPFVNEQHPERFSEEELKKQQDRAAAKAAAKGGVEEEEAPPAYKEEDLEDPEEATTVKKEAPKPKADDKAEEKPAEKPEAPAETKTEPKAETPAAEKPDAPAEEKAEEKEAKE